MATLPTGTRIPRGTRVAHRTDATITGTVTASDSLGEFLTVEWDEGVTVEGYAADELRAARAAAPATSAGTGNS